MHLYDTQRSGNAWKVRLMAAFLGLPLERTTLSIDKGDLQKPEFLRLTPFAQVPVLRLQDGSTLAESMAILFYLAQGSPWWPHALAERAQVLAWLSYEQERHMKPLAQLRLHIALRKDLSIGDDSMVLALAQAHEAMAILEAQLARQGEAAWVATCAHPSIADVALYPYTRMAGMGGVSLEAYPSTRAWLARMEALPGYQALYPGRPELNFSTTEIKETT